MMAQQSGSSQGYGYSSAPRAITKKKYREDQDGNMMYDRRIVRGNTYAAQAYPTNSQPDPVNVQRSTEGQKRKVMRQRQDQARPPATPDAVDGRKHIDVQTEQYLEELADRPIEVDIDTQTDAFMDRPASPIFIPMKIGVDADTQIYDGDLFDFDYEVEPILEVLTGKTLEQSMLEVMEEEELANMRRHQEEFERLRNAELAEVQRLEAAERRRHDEKERRMEQERARLAREKTVREKVAARNFAKEFLMGLGTNVFDGLQEGGYFYDPLEREIEEDFLPWLVDQTSSEVETLAAKRAVAEQVMHNAIVQGVEVHEFVLKEMRQEEDDKISNDLREWRRLGAIAQEQRAEEKRKRLEQEEAERKAREEEEARERAEQEAEEAAARAEEEAKAAAEAAAAAPAEDEGGD